MSFLTKMQGHLKTCKEFAFLIQIATPDSYDHEIKTTLTAFYRPGKGTSGGDKANSIFLGTFTNSVLCQGRYVFMSSQRDFERLLAKDKSIKRNTISGTEFKAFNKFLLVNKIIEVIRPPIPAKKKSGVYRVIDEELRALLSKTVDSSAEQTQLAQCLEIYEETRKSPQKSSRISSHGKEEEQESEQENQSVHEGEVASPSTTSPANQSENTSSSNSFPPYPSSLGSPTGSEAINDEAISLANKLYFLLGSKTLPEKDRKAFSDFKKLIDDGTELSTKSIDYVNGQYRRRKKSVTEERLEQWRGFAVLRGLDNLSMSDLKTIYGLMAPYCVYSRLEDPKRSEEMFAKVHAYTDSKGFEKEKVDLLIVSIGTESRKPVI